MKEHNVYATPKSWDQQRVTTNCKRDGKYVLVPVGSDLPPRCVICNEPALTPIKKRKVYWHHPAWYLLILFNILIYAIVGLIVRKRAEVSPGLCLEHTARRKRRILLATLSIVLMLILGLYAMAHDFGQVSIIALVASVVILIVAAVASQLVIASEITKTTIKLKGCKEPFLIGVENEE